MTEEITRLPYIDGPLLALIGGYAGTAISANFDGEEILLVGQDRAVAEAFAQLAGAMPDMSRSGRVIVAHRTAIFMEHLDHDDTQCNGREDDYPLATWWRETGQYQLMRQPPHRWTEGVEP